ncbi:ATP-binding cassette domain-containing protein [Corynebacterium sp. H130]|uniref:ATP-binding cassette domain-containing protein n=1 Tax=Corynebacterium sp. H130 TaxID=3133444 RepID=UPI00309DA924
MASPLNKRLLAAAPAARRHLILTGFAQATDTVLTVSRAVLVGLTAALLIERGEIRWDLVGWLAVVVVAQAGVAAVARRWASTSIGDAVDELRLAALNALERRDPREVEADAAMWRTTLTSGLEGVRPYLSDYVPALIATCLSTPIALATMLYFDIPAGVLAAATIPLIPLFMVLIGTLTRAHTERRLEVTSVLSGQLTDLMRGAPTLRALGATQAPARQLEQTGTVHANATMSVLRLAFLSSFALEFLATLSVALVAVSIGLRLVDGDMTLVAGLVSLIIAPEVYAPLRRVGTSFHAAVDGMTAAEKVFDLIDTPGTMFGSYVQESDEVAMQGLTVSGRDGTRPSNLSFRARPGAITVLAGPNGSGKSTALLALLGLLPDAAVSGSVSRPPLDQIAFLPAHPAFASGTVAENLQLFGARAEATALTSGAVGFDVNVSQHVNAGGSGISAGQGQRLALARVFALPDRPVLILDEPSAHLSPEFVVLLESHLLEEVAHGKTVLISSHDARLLGIADEVVQL